MIMQQKLIAIILIVIALAFIGGFFIIVSQFIYPKPTSTNETLSGGTTIKAEFLEKWDRICYV